ncbi:unnamed protein product, partial [Vitrella brassicaformis CCMP3155]
GFGFGGQQTAYGPDYRYSSHPFPPPAYPPAFRPPRGGGGSGFGRPQFGYGSGGFGRGRSDINVFIPQEPGDPRIGYDEAREAVRRHLEEKKKAEQQAALAPFKAQLDELTQMVQQQNRNANQPPSHAAPSTSSGYVGARAAAPAGAVGREEFEALIASQERLMAELQRERASRQPAPSSYRPSRHPSPSPRIAPGLFEDLSSDQDGDQPMESPRKRKAADGAAAALFADLDAADDDPLIETMVKTVEEALRFKVPVNELPNVRDVEDLAAQALKARTWSKDEKEYVLRTCGLPRKSKWGKPTMKEIVKWTLHQVGVGSN